MSGDLSGQGVISANRIITVTLGEVKKTVGLALNKCKHVSAHYKNLLSKLADDIISLEEQIVKLKKLQHGPSKRLEALIKQSGPAFQGVFSTLEAISSKNSAPTAAKLAKALLKKKMRGHRQLKQKMLKVYSRYCFEQDGIRVVSGTLTAKRTKALMISQSIAKLERLTALDKEISSWTVSDVIQQREVLLAHPAPEMAPFKTPRVQEALQLAAKKVNIRVSKPREAKNPPGLSYALQRARRISGANVLARLDGVPQVRRQPMVLKAKNRRHSVEESLDWFWENSSVSDTMRDSSCSSSSSRRRSSSITSSSSSSSRSSGVKKRRSSTTFKDLMRRSSSTTSNMSKEEVKRLLTPMVV